MQTISQAELDAIRDLRALQQEIEDPKLDSENPHFRSQYTSLREVLRIARPLCNKHNFVLIQFTAAEPHGMLLVTRLLHTGGHAFTGHYLLTPQKQDPQGMGAAVTYARRFSIKSMLCMADQDDDGNEASGLPAQPEKKQAAAKPSAGDFQEARKKALTSWVAEHVEEVDVFLHGPTWGKEGSKIPWLETTQSFTDLKPAQLNAITKSDASLEKFKAAVLSYNDLMP